MTVSDFQTLIKSCSIEPEMIQVQFKDLLFNRCTWVRQLEFKSTDGWCCEFSSQWSQLYFCWFWNPSMSTLYKNARNVSFVLFRKNSNADSIDWFSLPPAWEADALLILPQRPTITLVQHIFVGQNHVTLFCFLFMFWPFVHTTLMKETVWSSFLVPSDWCAGRVV